MGQQVATICTNCKKQSMAPVEYIGKKARCPFCKAVITVTATGAVVNQQQPSAAQQRPTASQQPVQRSPTSSTGRLPAAAPAPQAPQQPPQQQPAAQQPSGGTRKFIASRSGLGGRAGKPGSGAARLQRRIVKKSGGKKALVLFLTTLFVGGLGAALAWSLGYFENPAKDAEMKFKNLIEIINANSADSKETIKEFFTKEPRSGYDNFFKLQFEDVHVSSTEYDAKERKVYIVYEATVIDRKKKKKIEIPPEKVVWVKWSKGVQIDPAGNLFNEFLSQVE